MRDGAEYLLSDSVYGFLAGAGLELCDSDGVLEELGVGLLLLAPQSLCFNLSCAVLPLPLEGGGLTSLPGLSVVLLCENCV